MSECIDDVEDGLARLESKLSSQNTKCCCDYRYDSDTRAEELQAQLDAVLADVKEARLKLRIGPNVPPFERVLQTIPILDRALARKIGEKAGEVER